MTSIEKKMNKRLIGFIIGGAMIGVGDKSLTKKTKRLWKRIFDFLVVGIKELRKEVEK